MTRRQLLTYSAIAPVAARVTAAPDPDLERMLIQARPVKWTRENRYLPAEYHRNLENWIRARGGHVHTGI